MVIQVSGKVYSLDPIFSPDGYARCVFGSNVSHVEYEVEGKCLSFNVVTPVESQDIDYLVTNLIPASADGRKVEVNICVTT